MTEKPALVVGATGTTGSRVAALLRERGVPVRAASRSGSRRFDWHDRATWDAALDGAGAVFLVPLDGEQLTRPFVRRAVELGVDRVVLLSGRGVDVPGYVRETAEAALTHIDGEAAVRELPCAWTIVRPGWFAQNFSEGFFLPAVLAGELRLPAGDGAASFVDADDIAAVAVAALTEDGHAGATYELSGPRALTFAEAAAEISAASGRQVRYVPVAPDAFVAELVAGGLPRSDAEDFAEAVSPVRRDLDGYLSDGVQRVLGRPPHDFTEFAATAAAAGHWRD